MRKAAVFERSQFVRKNSFKRQITLVIDISSTLVKRVYVSCSDLPSLLLTDKKRKYLVINQPKNSCNKAVCECNLQVYKFIDHCKYFLQILFPQFELVVYSNFPAAILQKIVSRLKKMIGLQVTMGAKVFAFVLSEEHYMKFKGEAFENFHLLFMNRIPNNMLFMSGNDVQTLAAAA